MDFQYLLLLQNFRNGTGSFLTTPMLLVSDLATYGAVICCIVFYWAVSRSFGYWLMTNIVAGFFTNNVIKLTACVYRPWIRYPQIEPAAEALKSATGYSFPSGHTQVSASFFGSSAVRTGKEHKSLRVLCVAVILLTGFSRNFLGVHTPQDVLASFFIGMVLIWICSILMTKISETPTLLNSVILAGIIIVIAAIAYIHLKTYPMEYLDGALIVDPGEMKTDGYMACGLTLGFLIGTSVETRFIRFSTDITVLLRFLRVVTGIPLPLLFLMVFKPMIYGLIGEGAGHVVVYGILVFYFVAIHPALFTVVEKRKDHK